jgi:subfamily B ATP-binding cassette protein MsbA
VAEATTNSTGALIRDSLTIILQISWLFVLNWKLALFVVILAPPLSFIIRQVTKSFRRRNNRKRAISRRSTSTTAAAT